MVSQSLNGTVSRFLRPLGESILRLFGATPHSLFSRIETINAPIFRGLSYRYEKLGENSCDVEVTFPRPPSHPAIIAWDEALSMIVEGTAGKRPNISVSTRENSLRWNFSLRW
jgi:hypothetical protein